MKLIPSGISINKQNFFLYLSSRLERRIKIYKRIGLSIYPKDVDNEQ